MVGTGIVGVVREPVGRLVSGRLVAQLPVTVDGVCAALRPQVEVPVLDALQRPGVARAPPVRTHDEHADPGFVVDAVVDAPEAAVVPPYLLADDVHEGVSAEVDAPEPLARADVAVAPRADEQLREPPGLLGPGAGRPPLEEPASLVDEVVVPAGDQVGGNGYLPVLVPHRVGLPEVVERMVADDLAVELQVDDVVHCRHEGQAAVDLVPVHQRGRRPLVGPAGHVDEELGHVLLEHAVDALVAEVVLLRRDGSDGLQVLAAPGGGLVLGEADVGDAVHADAAVAPRLRAYPLDGVVAVVSLVYVRLPRAVGVVAAAAVLHDAGVSCLDESLGPLDVALLLLVVDRPDEEHGKGSFPGRRVDVGGQQDAVPHGNLDVQANTQRLSGRVHFCTSMAPGFYRVVQRYHSACME